MIHYKDNEIHVIQIVTKETFIYFLVPFYIIIIIKKTYLYKKRQCQKSIFCSLLFVMKKNYFYFSYNLYNFYNFLF